jgi:hypothetical protein
MLSRAGVSQTFRPIAACRPTEEMRHPCSILPENSDRKQDNGAPLGLQPVWMTPD